MTHPTRSVRARVDSGEYRRHNCGDGDVVTRNGKPAAVILRPEALAQLEETIDVLSDPQALVWVSGSQHEPRADAAGQAWTRATVPPPE
jgi:PHD/YefM family antitoxin component YafN of YafNO toxin-antitoxin module